MGLLSLNLIGTFVFGVSGGILAVRKRMDLFGILVLAIVAALGGGILRDLLLGRTPPATLRDWRYLLAAASAGAVVFGSGQRIAGWLRPLRLFDALGLALFTVSGTTAALDAELGPVPAALLGTLTGAGGGAIRDVLAGEIPMVLRREVYASAALLGAAITILAQYLQAPAVPSRVAAIIVIFTVRMVSVWRGWNIPATPFGGMPDRPEEN